MPTRFFLLDTNKAKPSHDAGIRQYKGVLEALLHDLHAALSAAGNNLPCSVLSALSPIISRTGDLSTASRLPNCALGIKSSSFDP